MLKLSIFLEELRMFILCALDKMDLTSHLVVHIS